MATPFHVPYSLIALTFATAVTAAADPPRHEYPADPPPHLSRTHWDLALIARGSQVVPTHASTYVLPQPQPTARLTGRFALELYVGNELLDRARFNVPLAGDGASHAGKNSQNRPHFDDDVAAVLHVSLADNPRAVYLLLIDRDTSRTLKFAWPPDPSGNLAAWHPQIDPDDAGAFPDGGVVASRLRSPPSDAGSP
jgi:hypothetical protein